MKTICAMREVFRAMSSFETAFEKVYRITLNESDDIMHPQRRHRENDGN